MIERSRTAPQAEGALADVESERVRQTHKWGVQRHSFPVWIAILSEEVGEFAQAVLKGREMAWDKTGDYDGPQHRVWLIKQREEAVQCAAVAVAIVEHLDELLEANHA